MKTSVILLYAIASDARARGLDRVQLVIPRRAGGSRRVKVLGGQKGVRIVWGELCCENADGRTVVWVDARELQDWLATYADARVELGGRP